ncbi:MAG: phosphotriesterase [Clostridiales bacterium]|nr:phosphotriesterase [Clostridiales bacterium]
MSFIRTMCGDIAPEALGVTYSHEHLVCRPAFWVERGEDDLILDDPEKTKQDVLLFQAAGGRSIVDATAVDYGRDPGAVRDIAVETGVQIVGTAGFNKSFLWPAKMPGRECTYENWIEKTSVDDLARFVIDEVEHGMNGTDVRAGQVKFGTGYNSIHPLEIKTIRAVARAHHATGAPIHSHTEAGTMALEQLQYLREEGVQLPNVCFGHMDRNPDPYMHLKLAETGAYLCFDGIAKVKYGPESVRIACIFELFRHGYGDQVLASGDTARKSYYYSYRYGLGLGYILSTWAPRLKEEADAAGLDGEDVVRRIFVDNPKRCFTFKKG